MPDEASELVGGISVSIGANSARLPGDLEAADRLIDQWAAKPRYAVIGVQAQTQQAVVRQAAPPPPSIAYGTGVRTQVQAAQSQTALQRAINAELGKTGEAYNSVTGEIESATAATQKQRTAVLAVQQEAAKPVELNFDTAQVQKGLDAILVSLTEITTAAQKLSQTPVGPATGGGGRGGGRRTAAPAAGGDEEEEGGRGLRRKNINARDIGTAADVGKVYTFDPAVYDEEDRLREAKAARQREAALTANLRRNAPTAAQRREEQRRASANYLNANPPESRAAQGIGATDINDPNYRSEQEIERSRAPLQQTAQQRRLRAEAARDVATARPAPIDAVERQRRSSLRDLEEFGRGRGGATALTDEDFARRAEQRIAATESARIATGRTGRTAASSFGGQFLFGGPARQQAEAVARQTEAEQRLGLARRRLNDPAIIRDANAYRHAITEQTVAEEGLAKATQRVQSFSGPGTALRSLAAVTVAGAAFGLALKGVDFAISTLGPAIGDLIDQTTGFGATSNKTTQALAQQTLAVNGNVAAVLAQSEAQAGLSATAADVLDSQLKLTTQVKAGAIAAGQQGGLFRAALGANQQTPQGLLGGYGGIGGGALLGQQLGGGAGFAETIKSTFSDFKNATAALQTNIQLPANADTHRLQYLTPQQRQGAETPIGQRPEDIARIARDRQAYEESLNTAVQRGAVALGSASGAIAHFATITDDQVKALQGSNLPQELKDLASSSNEALIDANGNLVTAYKQATDALEQAAAGLSIPDQATFSRIALAQEQQRQRESQASLPAIQSQQAFVRPAQIAAIGRQLADTLGRTLPATQALQNLANPLQPTGTGIAAANAREQQRINAGLKDANSLQAQLNAGYKEGYNVLQDTYKPAIVQNFGAAAGAAFQGALDAVQRTGQQIASIQAGISNEQAAYQVAQYNYQLVIARRTLSDIGGLTGKNFGAGESYLGVLERQNLALSRQGQLLQFALSQRQINFQTALAGFQAPGVTPEERQARIKEAQIEASFAQKQLNINKQQFQNQVKIVDISNLRQGADLARQIGLLLQGRRVTIDTQLAEKRLQRLAVLQQQQVARVSAYLTAVDNLTSTAMGNITQLETAAGRAMSNLAVTILRQFGIEIKGLSTYLNALGGRSSQDNSPDDRDTRHASGGIFQTRGMTRITPTDTVGEASGETIAILSHPRALSASGGGGNVTVNFNGDIHTDNMASLDKVTQAVVKALGREASIKGLRGIG